jgi:AcrR family transcriptional regulator
VNGSAKPMQERAEKTRESILQAAASVFERVGFSAARLEDIADEAQVTKGALYFHFRSKSDLAATVVSAHYAQWADTIAAIDAQHLLPVDAAGALVRAAARSYQGSVIARAGGRLANEQLIDTELAPPYVAWIDYLTKLLKRGKRRGDVRADLDCAAAARSVVASYFGIAQMSTRLHGANDLTKRIAEWWTLIEPTLRPAATTR